MDSRQLDIYKNLCANGFVWISDPAAAPRTEGLSVHCNPRTSCIVSIYYIVCNKCSPSYKRSPSKKRPLIFFQTKCLKNAEISIFTCVSKLTMIGKLH
jgi:hypothetical protein